MSLRFPAGVALAFGLILGPAGAQAARAASHFGGASEWNAPQKPFRIHGRSWYVGPHGLSAILIDTGRGLALIDAGLPSSAPLIEANIRALGFRVRDLRWILNSHAHADHAGGIAALQRHSGAQVLASAEGARELALGGADPEDPQYGDAPAYPPVQGARIVGDGGTVQLGKVAITAHYTPGHTPGSTSWTWSSCSGGHCLHMVYADSLTAIGRPGFRFSDQPRRVAAFRRSIAIVAALPCDILLTPHPDASGFWRKVARGKAKADGERLVDGDACRAYAAAATRTLDARLAHEQAR
ncbi:MAG TPA: subclass B3 metallo-beta-lactamase [Frateuria sp.]|uniref:subclass B3 metallo-beta-lactamase n=1 Tax=Frateuria sp. TaxID=2211372 RepID=UPI002D7FB20A|nr:subclass B3 metallo-beta-lactamase [Frateuria sp.]HET6806109.1 subclass B3 metallo-beta-lactamase [Frateuria sp.]